MKKIGIILLQVGLIYLFLLLAIAIKNILSIPLPATIIGLILLFLALQLKLIKLAWIEKGGRFLMVQLLLFFIPSAVGIVNYDQLLSLDGLWVVLIILTSTAIVLAVTGRVVERFGEQK
ncbi:CidA/LrgA family protein [Amphibacillus indicireducens]|uniref:CidA/LrgA family holin-like protein n=1 Tax=Amphibacillus indicireducens TaxID=1076330 RepID=A0ABP7V399_9BACI